MLGCGLYWSLRALPPWGVIEVAAPGFLGTKPPFATWTLKVFNLVNNEEQTQPCRSGVCL